MKATFDLILYQQCSGNSIKHQWNEFTRFNLYKSKTSTTRVCSMWTIITCSMATHWMAIL